VLPWFESLDVFDNTDLLFPPGSSFHHSSFEVVLISAILEGQPYHVPAFCCFALLRGWYQSEKLRQLRETLYALDNQMAEPLWPALVENSIPIDYTIDKIPDEAHEPIIWAN